MKGRPAHFSGFSKEAFTFFADLAQNNRRDWFLANKDVYESRVKAPMMDLVADLNTALAARDLTLHAAPKQALFRINRDIRFARDKSPYKTNVAAVLTRDGGKGSEGLLYLQFGLDECFAAVGFYALEPDALALFRAGILARAEAWRETLEALDKADLVLSQEGALTRLPRGFDAAEAGDLADWVKLKSFVVTMPIRASDAAKPALIGKVADFAARGRTLLEFGWRALDTRGA